MDTLQDFAEHKNAVRDAVETTLEALFQRSPATEVCEAAKYAVLGKAHRWRAITVVAAGRVFRPDALEIVLPTACSVELAHAASLVLDDLPSMDNAEVRRGKPCTHKVFPAWAVDMTPVFLITMAYDISLSNERVASERRVKAALELSRAGLQMIAGQVGDIRQDATGDDEQRLRELYTLKSGALYGASGRAGALLCGACDDDAAAIYEACVDMGLSMQFMDDVADVVADIPEVGKRSGMDAGKRTAVDWLGVEGANRKSREYQDRALSALERFGCEADWLRRLVREVSWATY